MKYKINVNHTNIVISDYELGDCDKLEKILSVYDKSKFKFIPIGYMYNEKTKELLVPRGIDVDYVERLFGDITANINYTPDKYDKISVKLKTLPKDNIQKDSIAFLCGKNKYSYVNKYSQLLLNIGTGIGKTYVSVAAMTIIGYKTMVITHTDKIKNQWINTFIDMTDLTENEVCNISGSDVINKLLKNDNLKYKVYVVNHGTIHAYARSNGWSAISELFKYLKIGMKIYDEAHLFFGNIIRTDLYTNTKKTIYLTATFERTDPSEVRLFKLCFKNIVKFENNKDSKKSDRKHIIYLGVLYNSKPPLDVQASMYTFKGFNKIRYSNYIKDNDEFFDSLEHVMKFAITKEGKIIVMASKIETAEKIKDFLIDIFKDKTIASIHSKVKESEREKALDADIICTTPQSAGTGFDLPGLRTIIMTESYSSKVEAKQVSGRLREYNKVDNTFYIEMVDIGFSRVFDMYKNRLPVFKKLCAKVLYLKLGNK